jgi:hypothetical protein
MNGNTHSRTQQAQPRSNGLGPQQAAPGLPLALALAVAQGGYHSLCPLPFSICSLTISPWSARKQFERQGV